VLVGLAWEAKRHDRDGPHDPNTEHTAPLAARRVRGAVSVRQRRRRVRVYVSFSVRRHELEDGVVAAVFRAGVVVRAVRVRGVPWVGTNAIGARVGAARGRRRRS
jgi:hypothetical protein